MYANLKVGSLPMSSYIFCIKFHTIFTEGTAFSLQAFSRKRPLNWITLHDGVRLEPVMQNLSVTSVSPQRLVTEGR